MSGVSSSIHCHQEYTSLCFDACLIKIKLTSFFFFVWRMENIAFSGGRFGLQTINKNAQLITKHLATGRRIKIVVVSYVRSLRHLKRWTFSCQNSDLKSKMTFFELNDLHIHCVLTQFVRELHIIETIEAGLSVFQSAIQVDDMYGHHLWGNGILHKGTDLQRKTPSLERLLFFCVGPIVLYVIQPFSDSNWTKWRV